MRRKDREITDPEEIAAVIGRCDVCRVGMADGGLPYVVPMNFGFEAKGGSVTFYLHCAGEGRKIDILKKNPAVCVELDCGHRLISGDTACAYSMEFESVIASGRAEFLTDRREKLGALTRIMSHYAEGAETLPFDERMVDAVSVIRIRAGQISGKRKKARQ